MTLHPIFEKVQIKNYRFIETYYTDMIIVHAITSDLERAKMINEEELLNIAK